MILDGVALAAFDVQIVGLLLLTSMRNGVLKLLVFLSLIFFRRTILLKYLVRVLVEVF